MLSMAQVTMIRSNGAYSSHMYYFFFQAEDGIRDYKVTGVQTCALPISQHDSKGVRRGAKRRTKCRRRKKSAIVRAPTEQNAWGEPAWRTCVENLRGEPAWRTCVENLRGGSAWRTWETPPARSEEHTSALQSPCNLACRP